MSKYILLPSRFYDCKWAFKERESEPRVADYFEEVVGTYSSHDFKRHFRISHRTYAALCLELDGTLKSSFRNKIPPIKQLLIFLWYISNQDSMREICHLFNLSASTVHAILKKVSRAVSELRKKFIVWPKPTEQADIKAAFAERCHMPSNFLN